MRTTHEAFKSMSESLTDSQSRFESSISTIKNGLGVVGENLTKNYSQLLPSIEGVNIGMLD